MRIVHFEHPEDQDRKIRVGACKKDKHDPSHTHYSATTWQPDELPGQIDLREHLTPVEDQGDVGSCTANALAGALEYLEKRISGEEGRMSRLFIYWNERDVEGDPDKDEGAAIADGIKVLRSDGVCSEDTWTYDKNLVFVKPEGPAYEEASSHTIDEAHRVKIELHDMRHCLAEGYPFVFGLQVYDSFQNPDENGLITPPDPDTHEHCGGHAMLCVGYSDEAQVFIVRNSWGPKWGDEGYCYIPYEYMSDPKHCHDAWTIRKAHDLDFSFAAAGDDSAEEQQDDDSSSDDSPGDDSSTEGILEKIEEEIQEIEQELEEVEKEDD